MKHILSIPVFCAIAIAMSVSAAEPSGYYSSCEGKSGDGLLKALFQVVNPHTVISYDGLWDLYTTSDVYPDGSIWDMYSTKHWSTGSKCGTYQNVGDCYNREHSLPKSWFNDAKPMYSDAYHIYPTDGKVNGQRSDFPFGECANGTVLASSNGIKPLGRLGKSTFPGYTGTVFEPDDQYKGDFARSYFYMAAAYNDRIASWSSDMLAKNSFPVFSSWTVDLLLKWHRQDPVSDKEIDRNEAVASMQKNRNPFIDHPELVEYIWGDKQSEEWYISGSAEPQLILPVNGSAVDFGITAVNYTISRYISVHGTNLTAPVTISVDNPAFTLSTNSITATAANGQNVGVSVVFSSPSAGTTTAVLTLECGDITSHVNLTATTIDGIPALPASDIEESSFAANWVDLGDEDSYTLTVNLNDSPINGYPRQVNAANESFTVTGLSPSTTYTYQLNSSTAASNVVSVTTATPIPYAAITNVDGVSLYAEPDTPSEATELWMEVENIDTDLTISVADPFELSTDHSTWTETLVLNPEEDRFYIRVGATSQGEYEAFIIIRAGEYINDDTHVEAFVTDPTTPWFIETFESIKEDSSNGYNATSFEGTTGTWNCSNVGFWKADAAISGNYALRLGNTSTSTISTAAPKRDGIGTITFYANRWNSSDGDVTLSVEYSGDNGASWQSAGSAIIDSDDYKLFSFVVNATGYNMIRLRQTAGKRGNIDDITVSDYRPSSVNSIEADDSWDSFSVNGTLVIDNHGSKATFTVFSVEGIIYVEQQIGTASRSFALSPGLYIVTDNHTARRVLVK